MSNLLEQASLVMIPSGYAEDIVYSEIPLDGSGDLQFTRASNGTRVNFDGLVEVVPWNLLPNSQTFASWSKVQISGNTVTVTDNFTIAPNGTLTAAKVVFGTFETTGQIYQDYTLSPTQVLNATLYAKVPSGTRQAYFGFFDGLIKTELKTLTTEWQRIEYTGSVTSGAIRACWFYGVGAESNVEVHLWGGQLNVGSAAKPYFPTTDRLNVPRLTYQNGGGGCPSLLLEPQRTNLILQSNTFNTTWAMFTGPAVTPNTTTSPDGTTSATTLNSSGGTNDFLYQTLSGLTVGATYSFSFYIKNLNSTASRFWGPSGSSIVDLSWSGSTLVSISGTGASFTSVGNDWYRVVQTGTTPTATPTMRIYADVNNTSKSVYIYGAQFEAGSYPTSYIPTTSASATRVADAYSRSLSSITAGTAYINITDNVALGSLGTHVYGPFAITSASLGLFLSRPDGQRLRLWTYAASTVYQTTVTNLKLAITWDGTNVNVYQNGVKVVTNYAYALTNVNNLYSSSSLETSATIAEIVLFNSVLTDAECISLTS
jgi:hypothetical protein